MDLFDRRGEVTLVEPSLSTMDILFFAIFIILLMIVFLYEVLFS